jgi:hypothetical protein
MYVQQPRKDHGDLSGNSRKSTSTESTPLQNGKKKRIFYTAISILSVLGYLAISFHSNEPTIQRGLSPNSVPENVTTPTEFNKPNHEKKIPKSVNPDYFTYGATIGEVISVQGPPDRINSNIWYYGHSEVHFKDGVVVKWKHDFSHPLKARIKLKSTISNEDLVRHEDKRIAIE